MKKNYTKKILLKVSLVLVLLVCVGVLNSQTYGPNLVLNPGFEDTGSTAWIKSGDIGNETINVISGSVTARFTGAAAYRHVQQVVDVQPQTTYIFAFKGRILDAAGPSGGTYTPSKKLIGFVKAGDTNDGEKLIELEIAQGVDIAVSGEFQVPESIDKVFIRIYKNTGICYVDDVILQMKDDVGTALNSPSSNFKVIPNGDNSITIRSDEALKNIRIINIYGQTILNTTTTNERINLPHNATKGIYIVEAITEKGTKMLTRFIKK